MANVSPLLLLRRFGAAWQQDGYAEAVAKTRDYVARRLNRNPVAPRVATTGSAYMQPMWQTLAQQGAFHVQTAPAVHHRRRHIAMIGDLNLPQCRKYRVEQMAEFWRARDVGFEYAHYEDVPRATRILQLATHLMEYRLPSCPLTQMLRYEAHRLRLPILYDLDDPLFSISAYETYGNMMAVGPGLKQHFLHAAPSYLSMMNGADMVTVSTPGLADHARAYTTRPLCVRRNFADTETLVAGSDATSVRKPRDGVFRIAFSSGSQGHEADLNCIIETINTFVMAKPERRLMLLGHFDVAQLPEGLQDRVEHQEFRDYAAYLKLLRHADCAVMPLTADTFNACKSAVRVLDAAAVGVPSIVADVGDLSVAVKRGETGFVASHATDWADALNCIAQPGCAAEMGGAARANLEEVWQGTDAPHIIDPEILRWVAA